MKSFNTEEYWKEFYEAFKESSHSSFAEFVYKFYLYNSNKDRVLIDIGCGNGRDSYYFWKCGFKVIGIDIATENTYINERLKFIKSDIKDIEINLKDQDIGYVYLRFFIHAIDEERENILIDFLKKINNVMIFIEARTVNDEMYGIGESVGKNEYISNHYRRFIDIQRLVEKFKDFKILYIIESNNIAIYKDSNPTLLRLIMVKNDNI